MLIAVDHRVPGKAKEKLSGYGEIMEIRTEGITYPAISGHPDIFFCAGPGKLIIAPNLPENYLKRLNEISIPFVIGEFPVGPEYPGTARYNAVVTESYLIHNFRHSDFMITRAFEDHTAVHVDQGYCRCNLLPLKNGHFITSDDGISRVLGRHTENVLKVTTRGILLEGFPSGFFGGCCGVYEDKVFVLGSLGRYEDGEAVEAFIRGLGCEVVELYDGPLVDGGGIFFIHPG